MTRAIKMLVSDVQAPPHATSSANSGEAEARLVSLAAAFQHAMIAIAFGSPDGHLRDVNPAFVRLLGYERGELLGLHINDVTHPDDRAADEAQWERLAAGELDTYQREKRYRRKDGSDLWGLVTVSALRDESGQFLGSSAHIQDVTAQRAAEAALRENEARLESLVEQLPIVLYSQPWGGAHAIRYVNPRFEQLTGLGPNDLATNHHDHLNRVHPEDRARVRAIGEWADRTGEPAHVEYRLRGGNGGWIWVEHHSVLMRDEQGQPLSWHGSIIDISERKRLEATLRESEVRFRRAFEGAAIGMAIVSPEDICLDVNQAYCAIVGMPRDEVIGRSFDEVTHQDDRAEQGRRLAQLAAGTLDSFVVEKRYLRPDGTVVTSLVTISAVRDDAGQLLYGVGQIQDITAQKAAAIALRESEELLRSMVERAPAAVYRLETGENGRFTFGSSRFTAMTGLSVVDGVNTLADFFTRVHPDDIDMLREADAQAIQSGETFEIEYRLRSEDGSWVWVYDRSSPTRDEKGRIVAWFGILLDISERKRLQAELRANEERLRVLVEQLPVALYSMTPGSDTQYTYVSPRFSALTGMSEEEIALGSAALQARIHPDDKDPVRQAEAHATASESAFESDYRVRRPTGEWVWLQDRALLARDPAGQPLAWHGALIDTTAQRLLEQSLCESEARFRSTFEGASIGMALSTSDCVIRMANPALERLFGYGSGELVGIDSDAVTHPEDIARHREQRARMISGEIDGYELEKRYIRKDGATVWVILSVTAIRDDRGKILTVIAQVQDITARKEAEAALRASEERFRSTFEGAGIGMTLADLHGRHFDANPAFCAFLGYTREQLLQLTYLDITHPDDRATSLDFTHRLFAGDIDIFSIEKRYLRADGGTAWGALTLTTVDGPDGTPLYEIAQVQDITARKEAEEALRASEERFRSTFEGAGIGMTLTSLDGRFIDANPAFCTFIGRSHDELLTLTSLDTTHPEDRATSKALIDQLIHQDIDAFSTEKRYLRPDGRTVWGNLTVTATRAPDGQFSMMIAQIEDITSRKEAESALRESEARFRAVVQNDTDVIVLIDKDMNVTYVSPSATIVFGASAEQSLQSLDRYDERVHPEDIERAQAAFRAIAIRPGAVSSNEVRILHGDATWHWFEVKVVNLLEEPGIQGFLVNLRDITERKQAELATAAALKTQEAAIAELERLNRSKSRFLSTISHEFRTPLTAIIGYSEFMMGNDADPALIAEDAEVIHREANRLSRMVDDVLLIDHVDAGRLSLNAGAVDLNTIARDVAETFRPLTEKHPLRLDLDPELRVIKGHRDRLAQAVTNLLSNAVKYSPNGGPIKIITRNDDDRVILSIDDAGIGIGPDDLARIFERFERVETGNAGRIGGTGLGLSIVKEILTLHGGQVWVESDPGAGSVFSISLPALSSESSTLPSSPYGDGYNRRDAAI